MSYYKLFREHPEGQAVAGKLYEVHHYFNKRTGQYVERLSFACATLENADYLIPALIYQVGVTASPRFQRLLPVLRQVPGREGIRFHRGSRPEHSKGCILVSAENEQQLTAKWLKEQQNHEQSYIEFCERRAESELERSPR